MEPDTQTPIDRSDAISQSHEVERLSSILGNLTEVNEDYNDEEDDLDFPTSNTSELQSFLERNTEVNEEDPQREMNTSFAFCPTFFSLILFSTYFIGVCTTIVVILALPKDTACDQPLKLWLQIQLVILVDSLIVRIWTTINQYKRITIDNQDISICMRLQSKTGLFLQKIMNMFWGVWFIVGMVWTFKSSDCNKLWYIPSLVIIIINLFLIGLCILCCVCALICFGFFYMLNPEAFGQQNRGAPKKVIEKLETKKYSKGLLDDAEDAKCAICLCSYEEGDELRFLPCKPKSHHYHRTCIDEWLQMNKTCPFCKRSIDAEEKEEVKQTEVDV